MFRSNLRRSGFERASRCLLALSRSTEPGMLIAVPTPGSTLSTAAMSACPAITGALEIACGSIRAPCSLSFVARSPSEVCSLRTPTASLTSSMTLQCDPMLVRRSTSDWTAKSVSDPASFEWWSLITRSVMSSVNDIRSPRSLAGSLRSSGSRLRDRIARSLPPSTRRPTGLEEQQTESAQ